MYERVRARPIQMIRKIADGSILVSGSQDWQAYLAWVAAGNVTPDGAIAPQNQDDTDAVAALSYPKLKALANMTPVQVGAWVDANVNTVADAKDALKTVAMAVCILARRL